MHWFKRTEEGTEISRLRSSRSPGWVVGAYVGSGKPIDMFFGFSHLPSARSNRWLWEQGVEVFQTLPKRTLKFVKFISVYKGRKKK